MENLNISDGRKQFTINGDKNRIISVNLEDDGILTRALEAREKIEQLLKKYETSDSGSDIFEKVKKHNEMIKEAKEVINYIFDYDVSTPVFGYMSPFAIINQKGDTYIGALFDAILPEIIKSFEHRKKALEQSDKNIKPYVDKYLKNIEVNRNA